MFTYLLDFIHRLLGSAEAIVGGGEDTVGEVLGWAFRNGRVRMERAESRCCRGVGSHSKRGVALARLERCLSGFRDQFMRDNADTELA